MRTKCSVLTTRQNHTNYSPQKKKNSLFIVWEHSACSIVMRERSQSLFVSKPSCMVVYLDLDRLSIFPWTMLGFALRLSSFIFSKICGFLGIQSFCSYLRRNRSRKRPPIPFFMSLAQQDHGNYK